MTRVKKVVISDNMAEELASNLNLIKFCGPLNKEIIMCDFDEYEYQKRLGDFKNYTYIVKSGSPDVEIIRYAKKNEIDVIVMGALGKSEQDRLVHGSTVANVSKFAHCHVIAIRNPAKQFTLPGSMY